MAVTYKDWNVIVKEWGTITGPETGHPVRVITPGGVYINYPAQLILDFLNEGKLPEFRCSPDYAKELYMMLMIEGNQLDTAKEENEKLKEEIKLVREDNDKFAEDVKQVVEEKNKLEDKLRSLQTNCPVSDEMQEQIKWLKEENALLDSSYESMKGELQEAHKKRKQLEQEKEELENQLRSLRKDNQDLGTAVADRDTKISRMFDTNKGLRRYIHEFDSEHEKEVKKLRADLEESHANNIGLAAELAVAKTKLDEANKKLREFTYGKYTILDWNELVAEHRRLLEKQENLESQIDILSTTCDKYREEIDKLTQENEELAQERDALWDQNKYSDKMYNQLMNEKKRLQENFEELKASSDFSMTTELATIFAEFTDKNDKNHADLSAKIDKFMEKYQIE